MPNRESGAVEAWLETHPEITVVARDHGGCYGQATTCALPQALRITDRWHSMESVSVSFLEAVRKSMAAIRIAMGAATVDPEQLTCAERLQYHGYPRREATSKAVLGLSRQGTPIKIITRTTRHSRKLVPNVLRGSTGDIFRTRQSSLDACLPLLDAEWVASCRLGWSSGSSVA